MTCTTNQLTNMLLGVLERLREVNRTEIPADFDQFGSAGWRMARANERLATALEDFQRETAMVLRDVKMKGNWKLMFELEPRPGREMEFLLNGQQLFARCYRKRQKRRSGKRSKLVVRLMSPVEYERDKLTSSTEKR